MRKTWLIPILLTTTSLPLVSLISCDNEEVPLVVEWDMKKDGQPQWKHDQFEGSFLTVDDITNAYYNNVDKQLLADDFLFADATATYNQFGHDEKNEAHVKIIINHLDAINHRISFEILETVYDSSRSSLDHCHFTVTDTPFDFVNTSSKIPTLYFHPKGTMLRSADYLPDEYWTDKKWSFKSFYQEDGREVSDTINYTIKDHIEDHLMGISDFNDMFFQSKYFENVTLE